MQQNHSFADGHLASPPQIPGSIGPTPVISALPTSHPPSLAALSSVLSPPVSSPLCLSLLLCLLSFLPSPSCRQPGSARPYSDHIPTIGLSMTTCETRWSLLAGHRRAPRRGRRLQVAHHLQFLPVASCSSPYSSPAEKHGRSLISRAVCGVRSWRVLSAGATAAGASVTMAAHLRRSAARSSKPQLNFPRLLCSPPQALNSQAVVPRPPNAPQLRSVTSRSQPATPQLPHGAAPPAAIPAAAPAPAPAPAPAAAAPAPAAPTLPPALGFRTPWLRTPPIRWLRPGPVWRCSGRSR